MKKTLILFLVGCTASAWAQSTCETRVDAHQKATTRQRVNYCLQPDYGAGYTHGPQLVYSSVDYYTVPQADAKPIRVTAKQGVFDNADVEVTRSFVQTRQFPKFTDGRVSEQYKREYQEALASGPEIAREAVSLTECEPQGDTVLPSDETSSGLKTRRTKPGRRWVQAAQVTPVEMETDTVEEISSAADSYTYEDAAYTPAGIAGEPAGDGQPIDAAAYSYAPATN